MTAYATRAELYLYALSSAVLTDVGTDVQDAHLEAKSRFADSYFCKRYGVPLASPDEAVKQCVCALAALSLLEFRGFNPDDPNDAAVVQAAERWLEWLKAVATGKADLDQDDDATPSVDEAAPVLETDYERGFNYNRPTADPWDDYD